jgi:Holliday junction resolvasome RuvABC endonuclease subunit
MGRLLVGLDMSLSSTGAAARWSNETNIQVLCFQQRKTDPEILYMPVGPLFRITRIRYDITEKDRFARSAYVAETVVDWIKALLDQNKEDESHSVFVYIEGYALGMAGSSSVSKLCELGGILRYMLWREKWTFNELSPSTVKKHFAASGRASKPDMLNAYLKKGYPLLNEVLNVKSHQHPAEDVYDAIGVLETGESIHTVPPISS